MSHFVHWLTTDWTGGYLLGTSIGIIIHYMFRAMDRTAVLHQWSQKQANLLVGTAARALVDRAADHTYEDGVLTVTANVLGLRDDEIPALIDVIVDVEKELRREE